MTAIFGVCHTEIRLRLKKGIVQLAIFLLLALSVIAVASVGVFAQQRVKGRPLSSISGPNSSNINAANVRGPCYPIGDVNGDGVIKPDDAQTILNYVAGLKPTQFFPDRADVNKDGKIDSVDAALIKQYLAESIKSFAACPPVISPNP